MTGSHSDGPLGPPPARRRSARPAGGRSAARRHRRVPARIRRRRAVAVLVAAALAVGLWVAVPRAWSGFRGDDPDGRPDTTALGADASPTEPGGTASPDDPSAPPAETVVDASGATDGDGDPSLDEIAAAALPRGVTRADLGAGVLSAKVPQRGSGKLHTVKGRVKAPGKGRVRTVRIRVEGGLKIDRKKFAAFVMRVLNDDRSWGHGDRMRFARTDRRADITIVLASPSLSAAMCKPLITRGTLSCRQGDKAILTVYRWVKAIPDYGKNRTGYRRYVVNHEVGHALGHGHESCPGRGRRAPVMMQQTKGLGVCRPNPWPFP